mmetsp:Transcript_3284/g.7186  ORF Transcript_3284/g.7186 Transcript_3284/m.7186 type:complete len:869 (-) Transcript_3284:1166-3772(-)
MATTSAPPRRQSSGGGFFDALPDIGVGDLINNIAAGNWDPASHFAGTPTHNSKSKSRSRKSKGRSVGSRKSKSSRRRERPPRYPSSRGRGSKGASGKTVRGLPGPDNGGPIDIDLSAVVALDQRKIQRRKEGKKRSSGSKKSKSDSTRHTNSGGGGVGGKSTKSRGSRKERSSGSPKTDQAAGSSTHRGNKKTHRSQSTVGTAKSHKSSKSTKTAGSTRSNRTSATARTSTTAKSSGGGGKSIKSTRSARSSAQAVSPSITDGKASRRDEIRDEIKRKSRDARDAPPTSGKRTRRKHRKGISKASTGGRTVRSNKTTKTAPVLVQRSEVASTTGVSPLKGQGSLDDRRHLRDSKQPPAECRDDQVAWNVVTIDSREEEYESSSEDNSSTDGGSTTDNTNDSSDDDDIDSTDNDDDADDEAESDNDTLSRAMKSIGIPIAGVTFDEEEISLNNSKRSKRSKRSVKSNKSRGSVKSKNSAKSKRISKIPVMVQSSESGSEIDDSEFYQGGSGDVLQSTSRQYRIVDELGKGTFGRVMKAYEIKRGSFKEKVGLGNFRGKFRPKRSGVVAVKITRNVAKYKRDAEIEANMLRKVNRSGNRGTLFFPKLMDEFCSPMGHHCVVLEKLGMSLYHVLKANGHQPFSTDCVREIGIQVFDALDHLHGIGIIHTDLKPENILLVSNNSDSKDMRIKLIDLGSAEYERDANRHSIVNTRQYRAPEILLRIGWSFPSDVWAAGCAIAELQLGSLLFPAKEDVEHLALIERIMGVFPRWMLLTASTVPDSIGANCFNPVSGSHRMEAVLNPDGVAYVNKKGPLAEQLGTVADCISISDVLQEILCIDPMFRPTARLAKELCVDIGKVQESDSDSGDETD